MIVQRQYRSFAQTYASQKRLFTYLEMGFATFQRLQNFISSIFFICNLRPSFIGGLDEQSQFERLGNDLFMNILAKGTDPYDIKLSCVGSPIKAAKLGSNGSTTVLTRSEKSGEATLRNGISNSIEVMRARIPGIDNSEDVNLILRCKYAKNSEFSIDVPARADEYYR